MERTPEPELMDDETQARAYAQADFSEPHERFVSLLRESLPSLPHAGVALDLGCGPGDVLFRYLPDAAAPRARYDLVFSNSMIHHLLDPAAHWQCVRRAPAGAGIFAMDLVRPASRAEAQRVVDTYAAGEPGIFRQDFFNSLLASYRVDEIRQQLGDAGLGYLDLRQASDRHWAVWG